MKEKRKHPRISVSVPVTYECYDDDGELVEQRMGVALDVSQGGILIESDTIIEANFIKIVFIGYNNKVFSIIGSVVHSKTTKTGRSKTGVCFHGGNNEDYRFITNLIRTYHYRKKGSSQGLKTWVSSAVLN
jgi:hypothetical protein